MKISVKAIQKTYTSYELTIPCTNIFPRTIYLTKEILVQPASFIDALIHNT